MRAPGGHTSGDRARRGRLRHTTASHLLDRLDHSLDLLGGGGIVPRASACLEGAARSAVDDYRFARLWGAADEACAAIGVVPSPLRRSLREPVERQARERLGDAAFGRELDRGRSLSLTNALQLGLESLTAPEIDDSQTV